MRADACARRPPVKLHNALVLSIVYNTTRPYLPPTSIRHSGFHTRGSKKRARDPPPSELEEKRKRLLKDAVMALGRRERGEVKLLGATSGGGVASAAGTTGAGSGQIKTKGQMAAADEERKRKRRAAEALSEAVGGTSRGGGGSVTADGVPTSLLASGKDSASLSGESKHRISRAVFLRNATNRLNDARSRLLPRSLARSDMSVQPSLPSFTEFNKLRYAAKRGYCPTGTPCMTGCSPSRTRRAWRAASKDEQRFYSAMPWRYVYLHLDDIGSGVSGG